MDNKYIVGIVGVVVAIILAGSFLAPVINDLSEAKTEQTEQEGAYGTLMYQGTPETPSLLAITYITLSPSENDNSIINVYKGTSSGEPITTIDIDALDGKKLIVYSDVNATLSIQNGKYVFTGNVTLPADSDITNTASVAYHRQAGMSYNNGVDSIIRVSGQTTYYYMYSDIGDYANFEGSNPPAMDTPAASINGVYIGEKYITTTIENPYSSLYGAIVVIVLASILIASVGYFIATKRE